MLIANLLAGSQYQNAHHSTLSDSDNDNDNDNDNVGDSDFFNDNDNDNVNVGDNVGYSVGDKPLAFSF